MACRAISLFVVACLAGVVVDAHAYGDDVTMAFQAVVEAHQRAAADATSSRQPVADGVGLNGGAQADPLLHESGGEFGCFMVNSDVGNERWAISWCQPGIVLSGNVFRSGGLPAFLWCAVTGVVGTVPDGSLRMDCLGADRCPPNNQNGGTCSISQWSLVNSINLPFRFFLP